MSERMFPIQSQRGAKPHPLQIPWSVAELAYSVYSAMYGRGQSLERLAERGGFGPGEMDAFLPDWRERCDEITRLRDERDHLQRFKSWVHQFLDGVGVPADPDPEHTAANGCRISGRLRWLLARAETHEAEARHHSKEAYRLSLEVAILRRQVEGHCQRIVEQSELLSKRAERPLTWTSEQPAVEAWYWWRPDSSVPGIVVRLRDGCRVYRAGSGAWMDVCGMGGEWCGPLAFPAESTDSTST